MSNWLGKGWAQPVVNRRWALICSIADAIKRRTNYRWSWPNHLTGYAHRRAVGLR